MIEIFIITFCTLIVAACDFRVTRNNMDIKGNGYGCTQFVVHDQAPVPTQYRVLVPWLTAACGGSGTTYLWLKTAYIAFAMVMSYLWINTVIGIVLLALFFTWASLYDYSDVYIEVGLFAAAFYWMHAGLDFAEIVVPALAFIGALNRETAVFIPMTALFDGMWMVGAGALIAFGIGYTIPRLKYGNRGRYCPFNMIPTNLKMIRDTFRASRLWQHSTYVHFLVLTLAVIACYAMNESYSAVDISMAILFVAMLVPSMWREIRVFAPVMLAVIPMVVSYL